MQFSFRFIVQRLYKVIYLYEQVKAVATDRRSPDIDISFPLEGVFKHKFAEGSVGAPRNRKLFSVLHNDALSGDLKDPL